ncbi:MAG: RagB/SusD family nutrient uptake outer membrane protein [Bacteroidales bacterium]
MKKIFFLLTILTVMASCTNDFLDKTPLDKLSEDAVFGSAALAQSYVNALYTVIPDPFQEGNIGAISDEGYFRYGGTSTRYIASGYMTPDNVMYMSEGGSAHNSRTTILNIWNRAYEWIYRMNYFLNNLDRYGGSIDEKNKDRLKGEVYFLRAWTYTNLIERYAGVPIVTKAYSLNDDYNAARANFDDCVDFILQDLEQAETLTPDKSSCVKGRINKDIVMALRSRLTLIAASPLFNDPTRPEGGIFRGTYSADKWTRAFNASKAIVDRADVEGAYALDNTYDGYWKNTDSKEIIWGKFFTNTQGNKAQLFYSVVYFNGWTAFEPTQAMALDYEMKNGKKIFEEGSGFSIKHPYAGRDPRFYKSVASPFSVYANTDNTGYHETVLDLSLYYEGKTKADFAYGKKEPDYTSKSKHLWHATNNMGLELNKWYIPTSPITESETGSKVYPWFRLAEMYLNYAEAAYNVGKEDLCREYLNKVRSRSDVMMPEVTESGESLWDRVVNERRVELAFEAFRYFDVRRWKTAPFYENVPFAGMRTMILQSTSATDTVYRVVRPYDETKNSTCYYWPTSDASKAYKEANGEDVTTLFTYKWLGKEYQVDYGDCCLNMCPTQKHFPKVGDEYPNYLMPIPANEITKSKGTIVQNPGY